MVQQSPCFWHFLCPVWQSGALWLYLLFTNNNFIIYIYCGVAYGNVTLFTTAYFIQHIYFSFYFSFFLMVHHELGICRRMLWHLMINKRSNDVSSMTWPCTMFIFKCALRLLLSAGCLCWNAIRIIGVNCHNVVIMLSCPRHHAKFSPN